MGGLFFHIAVVIVQPINLKALPTNDVSTFWPTPVVLACSNAAKTPPNVNIAHVSSATEATPVLRFCPGIEKASVTPAKAWPTASVPGKSASGPSGP